MIFKLSLQYLNLFVVVLATCIHVGTAQDATCSTDGGTTCRNGYNQATAADLDHLIDVFCGNGGEYPYYMYQEELDLTYNGTFTFAASDSPGTFDQATCNSGLGAIVTACTASGAFWEEGVYVVGDVTFSMSPCQIT